MGFYNLDKAQREGAKKWTRKISHGYDYFSYKLRYKETKIGISKEFKEVNMQPASSDTAPLMTELERGGGGEKNGCQCDVGRWKNVVVCFIPASISACAGGISPAFGNDARNSAIACVVIGFVAGTFALMTSCYGCCSSDNNHKMINAVSVLAGAFGIGFSIWGAVELG